jgi:ribonuclease HI
MQTNQRAELTAIQRALEVVDPTADVNIFSDSNYAIKCSTVWYVNWQRNNWTTAQREPVLNKDLVVNMRAHRPQRCERCQDPVLLDQGP